MISRYSLSFSSFAGLEGKPEPSFFLYSVLIKSILEFGRLEKGLKVSMKLRLGFEQQFQDPWKPIKICKFEWQKSV